MKGREKGWGGGEGRGVEGRGAEGRGQAGRKEAFELFNLGPARPSACPLQKMDLPRGPPPYPPPQKKSKKKKKKPFSPYSHTLLPSRIFCR